MLDYINSKKSFLNHCINTWNLLPKNIQASKSLKLFKKKAKEYTLKKCKLCQMKEIGDEFHYILICPFFVNTRNMFIKSYYRTQPTKYKLTQLCNTQNYRELHNLARLKEIILKHVISM